MSRVPGAHDGRRHAREPRRVPRGHRQVGCRDERARRGHRRPAAWSSTGTARSIVDVDPRTVAVDGPVYDRPFASRLAGRRSRPTPPGSAGAAARRPTSCASQLLALLAQRRTSPQAPGSPTSTTATSAATPRWRFPDDAGMVRVDEETGLGFAIATDANGRYCQLDPYAGRPARARRGVPQRRRLRRRARSPSPTA